jgi:hypothetical protein
MRRPYLIAIAALCALAPATAFAQYGGTRPSDNRPSAAGQPSPEDQSKKNDEWTLRQAPIPGAHAAGPCPYVKILYDASRYQEFAGGRESSSAVGYTGEIESLRSDCSYKGAEPITVRTNLLFELGKGPMAQGDHKDYTYWVAVTFRNQAVIEKQRFTLPVDFHGKDRVSQHVELGDIVIPRANDTVSGNNFEVLIGFEVTPQMADFNREGKRFRITSAASTPQQ